VGEVAGYVARNAPRFARAQPEPERGPARRGERGEGGGEAVAADAALIEPQVAGRALALDGPGHSRGCPAAASGSTSLSEPVR
jgi:hypothetical protein